MAGCKPNCCTQPRAAPWGNDVALIKVSRSVRATCFMRGNAPCGVKGVYGLRAFGAWHFCASAKMPNVSIVVYVSPGRCPGLWATFGLTARPNHLPGVLQTFVPSRHFTHDFTLFPRVFPNFLGIFARFALLSPCFFPQKCLLLHLKGAVAPSLHFDFYFAFAIISRLAKSLGNSVWIKSTKIICEG